MLTELKNYKKIMNNFFKKKEKWKMKSYKAEHKYLKTLKILKSFQKINSILSKLKNSLNKIINLMTLFKK